MSGLNVTVAYLRQASTVTDRQRVDLPFIPCLPTRKDDHMTVIDIALLVLCGGGWVLIPAIVFAVAFDIAENISKRAR